VSGISTHILDISKGRPAAGVRVTLERSDSEVWREIATWSTDEDGRAKQLLPMTESLEKGKYRLTFHTQAYFDACDVEGLYPVVQVTFTVANSDGHYHIPLLLTANGYSTYRGS
jgi:5-hydroxyisourate hydrolase